MNAELIDLARSLDRPGYLLKACVGADMLRPVLPARWRSAATGHVMRAGDWPGRIAPIPGYAVETRCAERVAEVTIRDETGDIAAHGYAAETREAFVFDRIVTAPAHRRKGLGTALMAALRHVRQRDVPELLVATDDGRALYRTLGWRTLSAYSTAWIERDHRH